MQVPLSSPRSFKWSLRTTKAGKFLGSPSMPRGFLGCRTFSAKTGTDPGKPGVVHPSPIQPSSFRDF